MRTMAWETGQPDNAARQRTGRAERSAYLQRGSVPGRPLNADPLSNAGGPAMVIRATKTELDIEGSQRELAALADRIERIVADGEVAQAAEADVDPRPYDRCLVHLRVRATNGPVRISVVGDELVATGSTQLLGKFASFFRFDPAAQPGTHHHHDWFDSNGCVAEDSRSLVISVG
jgi:hypothetical protein